jgi:hypothetical protein
MPKITSAEINGITMADISKAIASYDANDRIWEPRLDHCYIYLKLSDKLYPANFIMMTAIVIKYPLKYERGVTSRDMGGFSQMMVAKLKRIGKEKGLSFDIVIDETKKRKPRRTSKQIATDKSLDNLIKTIPTKTIPELSPSKVSEIFGINVSDMDNYYDSLEKETVQVTTTKPVAITEGLDRHLIQAYKELILEGKIGK